MNGLIRLQIKKDFYNKVFLKGDTRKAGSIKAVYQKDADGNLVYVAPIPYKFQGTMIAGSSTRSWLDDYPIYRYADCLLLLAEAKALLGKILQRKSMRCVNVLMVKSILRLIRLL